MSNKLAFIQRFYNYAMESEKFGVPGVISLAQAGLESGWKLNPSGFNFFGIKANKAWKGKKQLLRTREVHTSKNVKYPELISITPRKDGKYDYIVRDWFRKYDSPKQSFIDHALFLRNNKRYSNAFKWSDNPAQFAREIAKAGYATDPNYSNILISIINTINKSGVKRTVLGVGLAAFLLGLAIPLIRKLKNK